jgi:hypothetical protein
MSRTLAGFCSYSHKDNSLRERLFVHLRPLVRRHAIDMWWDGEIRAGDEWQSLILTRLEKADLILLLLSADFLASEFVWNEEIPRALRRHEAGAIVIPIMLKPIADFHLYPFSRLQTLPKGATAITSWADQEDAFRDAVEAIGRKLSTQGVPSPERVEPDRQFPDRANVPSLLPYLCNRSDQERELTNALQRYVGKTPRKPFVCIVHGNASECHGDFVERMQRTAISRTLKLHAQSSSPEPHVFPWPSNAVPSERYLEVFRSNLALQLLNDGLASLEDVVNKCIAVNERTLVLTSILYTRNFAQYPERLLNAFLEFCRSWPNLPPARTLIHFVCIKHERLEDRKLLERRRLRKASEQVRALITDPDFFSRAGVDGIVLPELQGIQLSDAVEWRYKPEVLNVRTINSGEIQSLYQRRDLIDSNDLIPMEVLAGELKTLLSKPYS